MDKVLFLLKFINLFIEKYNLEEIPGTRLPVATGCLRSATPHIQEREPGGIVQIEENDEDDTLRRADLLRVSNRMKSWRLF